VRIWDWRLRMPNLEISNTYPFGIIVWNPIFDDETLTLAAADTIAAGTLLARKLVDDAVVVAAGTNTGNGTVTLATVAGADIPAAGAWNFEMTAALVAKLEDPSGRIVASNIAIADGVAIVLNIAGFQFTVTDGGTPFIAGDSFSLTVAANGNLVLFATDGVGGAQAPKFILSQEYVSAAGGDFPIRPLISGEVRREDLIIDADGDGSNITDAIIDELRDFTMIASTATQLGELDNQ